MPVPQTTQDCYNQLITDKFRKSCLTQRGEVDCEKCLRKQDVGSISECSGEIINVCQIPGIRDGVTSPRRWCDSTMLSTITNCPGGAQEPPPDGAPPPLEPTAENCSQEKCGWEHLPVCVMPNRPPAGAAAHSIVHPLYIENISEKCNKVDPTQFNWGTKLTCTDVVTHDHHAPPDTFQCNDAQWQLQINKLGERWAGINGGHVAVTNNDGTNYCSSKKCAGPGCSVLTGICSDNSLTQPFQADSNPPARPASQLYDYQNHQPLDPPAFLGPGGGNPQDEVWRTVKLPIDEVQFNGDTIGTRCLPIDNDTDGEFKCASAVGQGYTTIFCNGKEQRMPIGQYPCPKVRCDVKEPHETYDRCYCVEGSTSAQGASQIQNYVGKYVIGKLHLPHASQSSTEVEWHKCEDQSLATDRTMLEYIGDDTPPNFQE